MFAQDRAHKTASVAGRVHKVSGPFESFGRLLRSPVLSSG